MPENENSPTKIKSIEWTAPEFIHYPKSVWWYVFLAIISFSLAGYFLWQKDILTAVLFILFFVVIFYFGKSRPKAVRVKLSARGIELNNVHFRFAQIKCFWIVYELPEIKTLNIETTSLLNRFITLQLESEDPVAIRDYLLDFLPEDLERGEQTADKLSRTLKF